jgi:hypothetical protein
MFEYSPSLWGTIAQLGGGGIMMPLYYLAHLIFYRPAISRDKQGPRINLDDVVLYIPLLLIFHTVPVLSMYLVPDMQDRHWWTWMWQTYPTRVTIGYYVLRTVRSVFGGKSSGSPSCGIPRYPSSLAVPAHVCFNRSLGVYASFGTVFALHHLPSYEATS